MKSLALGKIGHKSEEYLVKSKKEENKENFPPTNKKIYFNRHYLSNYDRRNMGYRKYHHYFLNNRLEIRKLSIKNEHKNFTTKEIGVGKNLPYGIFSYQEKITNIWSLKDRWKWLAEENELIWGDLELSSDLLKVTYRAFGGSDEDSAAIKGNFEIPNINPVYYFEVKILNTGREGFIGIGFAHLECDLDRLPGWEMYSFGYHGDDGHLFNCSGTGKIYGPRFYKGDIIGVCWNLIEKTVFFTKNGQGLPLAFRDFSWFDLPLMVPIVGLRSEGESVLANFGQKFFEFDLEQYFIKFTEHQIPRMILMGKLEFVRKCFKYNKSSFTKNKKSFSRNKICKLILCEIFKKKKAMKRPKFFYFEFKKKKSILFQILENITTESFSEIFVKFITPVFFLVEKPLKFSTIHLMNYWKIFEKKNNPVFRFKKYLSSLLTREMGEIFFRNLGKNINYKLSSVNISNISLTFCFFFFSTQNNKY